MLALRSSLDIWRKAKWSMVSEDVLSSACTQRLEECNLLMQLGVNTGFGGSADVRTNALRLLQKGLVQHQNSAILSAHDIIGASTLQGAASDVQSSAMPTAWARGLMLARLNSIIRGHSAVSVPIIKTILAFLEHEITPIIPKRGSISARFVPRRCIG